MGGGAARPCQSMPRCSFKCRERLLSVMKPLPQMWQGKGRSVPCSSRWRLRSRGERNSFSHSEQPKIFLPRPEPDAASPGAGSPSGERADEELTALPALHVSPCSRESLHSTLPSHHATMDDAPLPVPPVPAPAPAPAPPAAAPRVPFHCSECGKSFRYRSDLRRHFARHTALKPHACPRCGKGFKHSFNLANHLRSHTGERPYRCSACPKGFRDSTGLLHHQVVHTGEKPYCCLVCELRFSSRSSLGRHLKRQHRGVLPSPLQPGPGLPSLSAPCSVCCNVGPCSVCGGAGAAGGEAAK
ncbi:flt3-interacting zinc finger protein 1-like [Suricata suricatta]|uniref:flt3-interacting zinc finger protein 1-like n=1 Tax=Suricata suricatta TaxID=37032 RepID=UPI001155EDCE|nr:flt3-interacting zinc finger protein 1-like [Suricata suricatta]